MKDISTKNNEANRDLPVNPVHNDLQPLVLDPDAYRKDLDEFDLTREQQDEMLAVLWNIMRSFVEIGFGLDSVQMFSTGTDGRSGESTGPDSGNMPGQAGIPRKFNKAAIEHATDKEENSSCAKE